MALEALTESETEDSKMEENVDLVEYPLTLGRVHETIFLFSCLMFFSNFSYLFVFTYFTITSFKKKNHLFFNLCI